MIMENAQNLEDRCESTFHGERCTMPKGHRGAHNGASGTVWTTFPDIECREPRDDTIRYDVNTWVKDGMICQEVRSKFKEMQTILSSTIMNARDQGVKAALMKLGWTPPLDAENPNESIKSILDLIIETKGQYGITSSDPVQRKLYDDAWRAQGELEWFLRNFRTLKDENEGLKMRLQQLMENNFKTYQEKKP